jgi:archaellum component FlaF (FlaF/FlaG flagellin family)
MAGRRLERRRKNERSCLFNGTSSAAQVRVYITSNGQSSNKASDLLTVTSGETVRRSQQYRARDQGDTWKK